MRDVYEITADEISSLSKGEEIEVITEQDVCLNIISPEDKELQND